MKKLLLTLIFFAFVLSCGGNSQKGNSNSVKFNQVGYYKSADKYRCFAYTYSKDDEQQIKQHARKQMNSSGKSTYVYYFSNYNSKNISSCNSFLEATELCLDLNWKYEYFFANGKERFRKNK